MAVELAALNFFMPILSFLLVFVLIYAILVKTEILGDNKSIHLLISFIMAVFFIVEVSLVDFVNFSTAWFAVFVVCLFFMLIFLGFVGKDTIGEVTKNKAVAWVLLIALVVFFIISSAYTFNWAINWESLWSGEYADWTGMVILLVVAGIVSWVLARKVKK